MNGAQDMGGMQGFGPVQPDPIDEKFHDTWEPRAFALALAMGATGAWNLDMARAARESLPPASYLGWGYYRIWFEAMEKLLLERGLVTVEELEAGRSIQPAGAVPKTLAADAVAAVLARGGPTERPAIGAARFAPGDRVRTRLINPETHTRLPRYVRGRSGTVVSVHGAHVYPDTHAIGQGEHPTWLYTVRFEARELWGEHTTAASVCVDCWEHYLEQT